MPKLCRPSRAPPKGKVARGITAIRRHGWPSCPDVPALDALQEARGGWLAAVAHVRMHGPTHAVPFVRWAQEPLRPVKGTPYDRARVSTRWSRQDYAP